MDRVAKVAVDRAAPRYDREYDYRVPEDMDVRPGCRVTVPFGARDQRRLGLVMAVEEDTQERERPLKAVATLVDQEPLLGEEQLSLLHYLRDQTYCGTFDALKVLIPAGYGILVGERYVLDRDRLAALEETGEADAFTPEERQAADYLRRRRGPVGDETLAEALGFTARHPALASLEERGVLVRQMDDRRRIQDERVTMVRLTDRCLDEERPPKLTDKQRRAAELLGEVGTASVKELCYFCGFTKAVVERMVKAGLAELYEQPVFRPPDEGPSGPPAEEYALTPAQRQAYDALQALRAEKQPPAALLYGVTGSGKTQVFLRLVRSVVAEGKTAIVMVPEIALTPQTIREFRAAFGGRTAVLHSSLTLAQRLDEWKRVRQGEADVVVGTRSAVFAPLQNIGVIVMDEEQEHTYKSESAPRYHAREVAKVRCRHHGALLLLCSATPSVESYHLARSGKYRLVTLDERFTGSRLPDVYLVDMRQEREQEALTGLSSRLQEELYHNLQAGEQSILLLNRRGYHTAAQCSSCGEVIRCPNCSVALTYHSANRRLLCHYCGHSQELPKECPACGSPMVRYSGVGTQRVEEQLHALFPDARVLRMDMDTTLSRSSYERKFAAFAAGEYDIMVGTQMVAKGLNFPRVTLVGVLSADSSLYSDDFRSMEKTFALLTQVVGRSGRGELIGRAFIQTATPEHPVFALAARQDYPAFFRQEIAYRKAGLYPPFCDLVMAGFTGQDEDAVRRAAERFTRAFAALAGGEYPTLPVRLLGPGPGTPPRVAGKYRYKLLVKCRGTAPLRELLHRLQDQFYEDRQNKGVTLFLDGWYDRAL